MSKNRKINLKSGLSKIFRGLWTVTLIPYGIATYRELKTVDWMPYWQTVKVTAFVIVFSVIIASLVYGVDQIITNVFKLIKIFN